MLKVLTDKQIENLINAPDCRTRQGRRNKALLSILIYGGLRIAEVCNLKRDEIQIKDSQIRLTFAGKGGRVRTVTLPIKATESVLKHMQKATSDYLFAGRSGPLSPRSGHFIVCSYAKKIGLPDWVHPHSLRHTYGTKIMRETGDIFLVSRVLGHADISTTAKYYLAYDPSYADKAAEVWK